MIRNSPHSNTEKTPNTGKMCGCFHEAYRLMQPIREEVLKILSQLPKHHPIIFDGIDWRQFKPSQDYHNGNFSDIERATRGCEQGNLELCAHPQPGFNEIAGKLRHEKRLQMLSLYNHPYVPEGCVDNLLVQGELLDIQIYLRDSLFADYMRTLYQPDIKNEWLFDFVVEDLDDNEGWLLHIDFDLYQQAHDLMASDDFFAGKDRPQMQAFFRHMQTITLHIMAQYHSWYHERETLKQIAGMND